MQVGTHEGLAKRISTHLEGRLPARSLIDGATAPGREAGWPRPHHLQRRASAIITQCTRRARELYLGRHYAEAAHQLGAAMHYALDNLVRHPEGSRAHAEVESTFAQAEHSMTYPAEADTALADGRVAQRAISQLVRLASTPPSQAEQVLDAAYSALLRLSLAVTEAAEPMDLLNELAQAHMDCSNEMATRVGRRTAHVQSLAKGRLRSQWLWTAAGRAPLTPAPPSRRLVGVCALLEGQGQSPALHVWAADWLIRAAFQRRLRRLLDAAAPPEAKFSRLVAECRILAQYLHIGAKRTAERRSFWHWFHVRWAFWTRRSRLLLRDNLRQIRAADAQVVRQEESELRRLCAEEVLTGWKGCFDAKLSAFYARGPKQKAAVYAVPPLVLLVVCGALALLGWASPGAAAAMFAAGTAAYVLTMRRVALGACAIGRMAEAANNAPADHQPQTTGLPGASSPAGRA